MADSLDYLSLISALSSSNSVQNLYSTSDLYSASNLYGTDNNSSLSFDSIFGNCIDALQSSNSSLLSGLLSSDAETEHISEEAATEFIEKLEHAVTETCDCNSATLVKDLYDAYLADTTSYAKNRFNHLISSIHSDTASTITDNTTTQTITQETNISIPTEEEIDAMIAASLASIPL